MQYYDEVKEGIATHIMLYTADSTYWSSPKGLLNANLFAQIALCGIFLLFSLFFTTKYLIITAIYLAYALASFYIVNKKQEPVYVGLIIGAGAVMAILSFSQAVLRGQIAGCTISQHNVQNWSCTPILQKAMSRSCTFAVFMFMLQLAFTIKLHMWKASILAENDQYIEVSQNMMGGLDFDEASPLNYQPKGGLAATGNHKEQSSPGGTFGSGGATGKSSVAL